MGLENKNWDSLSDSTILVETHNWFVNMMSLLPYKTSFPLLFSSETVCVLKIFINIFIFNLHMNL